MTRKYSKILKFNEDKASCNSCVAHEFGGCEEWRLSCGDTSAIGGCRVDRYYVNSDQLWGLMAEAEARIEYVVVKDFKYVAKKGFSIWSLATTDIKACVLKSLMLNEAKTVWDVSSPFDCCVAVPELLRLGFLEKKIDDPVVKNGEVFKYKGSKRYAQVVSGGTGLCNMIFMDNGLRCNESPVPSHFGGVKLSALVGKDMLGAFRRVTVDIVERGDLA